MQGKGMVKLGDLLFEEMVGEAEVVEAVERLATQISEKYKTIVTAENPLSLLCVQTGAINFLTRLQSALASTALPTQTHYIRVKSTSGMESTGVLQVLKKWEQSAVKGRHVLVIEDLIDTGLTLNVLESKLNEEGPLSLSLCVMIEKTGVCQNPPSSLEFVGLKLANLFLVGQGMDYNEMGRDLKGIYKLASQPAS